MFSHYCAFEARYSF